MSEDHDDDDDVSYLTPSSGYPGMESTVPYRPYSAGREYSVEYMSSTVFPCFSQPMRQQHGGTRK